MALTLITTPGGATANAYDTLAAVLATADEMFPAPDDLLALSMDDQNRLIVQMTRRIDQESLRGERATTTQALAYPRAHAPLAAEGSGSDYGLGYGTASYEDSTLIPDRVKRALAYGCSEMARLAAGGDAPGQASDDAGLTSLSLGSTLSVGFAGGATTVSAFDRMIGYIVRPILGNLVMSPQVRFLRG